MAATKQWIIACIRKWKMKRKLGLCGGVERFILDNKRICYPDPQN